MSWLVVGVVGALIAAAVGFRIHLTRLDRLAANEGNASVRADTTEPAPTSPRVALATPTTTSTEPSPTNSATWSRVNPTTADDDTTREHERRVAEAERSVQIDFYGESWCPTCRKARMWLDSERIGYRYRDTSDQVNKHTMRALNPDSTIPTIDIEGQVIVGFDAEAMRASIHRAAEARVAKSTRAGVRAR